MKIFDISVPLCEKTAVWEGDVAPTISRIASIEQGEDFNVSRIEMGAHTGTHIDAPRHLFTNGQTVDEIPLENFVGPVHVLAISEDVEAITLGILEESGYRGDEKRLLFKTRNSRWWRTDPYNFHKDFIAIDSECAAMIAEKKPYLVGIDYFSISSFKALKSPHEILLNAGITILENVDLFAVEAGMYDLCCLPLKLIGTDGAPVRAILIQSGSLG